MSDTPKAPESGALREWERAFQKWVPLVRADYDLIGDKFNSCDAAKGAAWATHHAVERVRTHAAREHPMVDGACDIDWCDADCIARDLEA